MRRNPSPPSQSNKIAFRRIIREKSFPKPKYVHVKLRFELFGPYQSLTIRSTLTESFWFLPSHISRVPQDKIVAAIREKTKLWHSLTNTKTVYQRTDIAFLYSRTDETNQQRHSVIRERMKLHKKEEQGKDDSLGEAQ